MTSERPSQRHVYLRLLRSVAVVDLAIFVVAGVIAWIIGWRSLFQVCDAVVLGGMIAISIGLWMFFNEWNLNRSLTYMRTRSMTEADGHRRVSLLRKDDDAGYRFFFVLFIAGLVAALLGALVQLIFA